MYPGANGLPDFATRQTFLAGAAGPVFLTQGPDGALYYADLAGGTVRRVAADNNAPTARITANPASGTAPLTVAFSGTTSSDPEGQALTYAWDLDGDGAYDDSTAAAPSFTYPTRGHDHRAPARQRPGRPAGHDRDHDHGRRAADGHDRRARRAATTWAVGDTVSFSGSARNSARRDAARLGAALVAEPAPLLARRRDRVPHARDPGLRRRRVRGASSRPTTSTRRTCCSR